MSFHFFPQFIFFYSFNGINFLWITVQKLIGLWSRWFQWKEENLLQFFNAQPLKIFFLTSLMITTINMQSTSFIISCANFMFFALIHFYSGCHNFKIAFFISLCIHLIENEENINFKNFFLPFYTFCITHILHIMPLHRRVHWSRNLISVHILIKYLY